MAIFHGLWWRQYYAPSLRAGWIPRASETIQKHPPSQTSDVHHFDCLLTRQVAALYESSRHVKSQAHPSLSVSTGLSKVTLTRYLCLGAFRFSFVGGKQCASSHCMSIDGQSYASPTFIFRTETRVIVRGCCGCG